MVQAQNPPIHLSYGMSMAIVLVVHDTNRKANDRLNSRTLVFCGPFEDRDRSLQRERGQHSRLRDADKVLAAAATAYRLAKGIRAVVGFLHKRRRIPKDKSEQL